MRRERTLKVVLVLVGLLFTAAIYPMVMILWQRQQPQYETAMGLSLYGTLGIMLLNAARNPLANRSLISFGAWSSFAHATVTVVMVLRDVRSCNEWPAPVMFVVIGLTLLLLALAKAPGERTSAATALIGRGVCRALFCRSNSADA